MANNVSPSPAKAPEGYTPYFRHLDRRHEEAVILKDENGVTLPSSFARECAQKKAGEAEGTNTSA